MALQTKQPWLSDALGGKVGVVGRLAIFCGAWALIEALGYSIMHHYALVQIVDMRYGVHLLILGVVFVPRVGWRGLLQTRRPVLQVIRGLCMFVMPASFIFAAAGLGSGAIWSTFWVTPIFVLVLAAVWLGERVSLTAWVLGLVGCVGAFMVYGQGPVADVRVLGAMLGAASFAVYVALCRVLREEPIEVSLFYTGLIAFLCMLPFAVAEWQPLHGEDVPRIVSIGVIGLLLLLFLDRSIEQSEASFVAPLLYGVVVCEALLRALRSGSVPPQLTLVGAALVLLVMLIALRRDISHE